MLLEVLHREKCHQELQKEEVILKVNPQFTPN